MAQTIRRHVYREDYNGDFGITREQLSLALAVFSFIMSASPASSVRFLVGPTIDICNDTATASSRQVPVRAAIEFPVRSMTEPTGQHIVH